LKATVQLALQHPEVRDGFEAYLRECMSGFLVEPSGVELPEVIEV